MIETLLTYLGMGAAFYAFFFHFTKEQRMWCFKFMGTLIGSAMSAGAGRETSITSMPPFPKRGQKMTGSFAVSDVPNSTPAFSAPTSAPSDPGTAGVFFRVHWVDEMNGAHQRDCYDPTEQAAIQRIKSDVKPHRITNVERMDQSSSMWKSNAKSANGVYLMSYDLDGSSYEKRVEATTETEAERKLLAEYPKARVTKNRQAA